MPEAVTGFFSAAGYWLAAFMLAVFPAAVLYWVLIHPFAAFWRRRGPAVAYTVVAAVCLGLAALIFQRRGTMLAVRWPFSWWLVALGAVLYGAALWFEVQCRRYLKVSTLVGAPELGNDPGRLLTEGIYRRLRHPRYSAVILGVAGWACFLNYPAIWILAIAVVPAFYLVMLLEERELRERFGEEYERYMREVPNRLIPRLGQREGA
ncbi:MAG: methyltransferase family protein [Thermoanaerobaculia bacterium]